MLFRSGGTKNTNTLASAWSTLLENQKKGNAFVAKVRRRTKVTNFRHLSRSTLGTSVYGVKSIGLTLYAFAPVISIAAPGVGQAVTTGMR